MAGFYSLEIGKRALLAQRFGIDVTSNNIGNVNTPGYSRRTVLLTETPPGKSQNQYVGTGAKVSLLRNFRSELLDKEVRTATSQVKSMQLEQDLYQKIDAVLAEPSENGLNELTNKFLSTFNNLALIPDDIAQRQFLLEQAHTLAERFNSTAIGLSEIRNDTKFSLNQQIQNANKLIQEIVELNKSIVNSKVQTNSEAQTLVDKRANKLEELSNLFGINVSYNDDGTANVFVNGSNIITSQVGSILRLNETVNEITGEKTLEIIKINPENQSTTIISPQSGEISTNLKFYNIVLDDKESTNSFSIAKQLDKFANALVQSINSKTITGFGINDKGQQPPGRTFFEPNIGFVSASLIKVSKDIEDKPEDIPLSSKPSEPGNNDIARAIGRILEDRSFLDGQNPSEFYANFLGKVSYATSEAINGLNTSKLIQSQLETQRESLIGVNLDEEAISLIKFQKAFEAASRVINTANEMLNTIVNLGR